MSELTITAICHLLESRGAQRRPTASVSLLEHSLQTAWLAERAGASGHLICACLLHDIGHIIDADVSQEPGETMRRLHGPQGAAQLGGLFGAAVVDPVRLHVDAKRYLCYAHPGYAHGLSPDARRSLEAQGGAFGPDQARSFMQEPHAVDAVNLRLWDDQAHAAGIVTPALTHYAAMLRTCVLPKGSMQVTE